MLKLFALLVLAAAAGPAATITIISNTGTTEPGLNQQVVGPNVFATYAEVGWQTGSSAYSNVTITADLEGSADDLVAYLTETIGAGTTSADYTSPEIAVDSPGAYSEVTLFSGIALNADTTYYLTLAPDNTGQLAWAQANGTITLDTGVSYLGANYCTADVPNCADYPPASPGFTEGFSIDPAPVFAVTSSSVPEPATFGSAALAAALAIVLRRRSFSQK